MNEHERRMIEGLFQRLQQAEAQAGPRDAAAEALIHDFIARQPAAPYLLAQVVLVQEEGLRNLQSRVEELERQPAERPQGGGFLGGFFGGGQPQRAATVTPQPVSASGLSNSRFSTQGAQPVSPNAQGGGFMAGALQTAIGVAGGVLLGNAVAGLFSSDAQAAEAPAAAAAPEEPDVSAGDEGDGLFGGLFGGDEDEFF